MKVTSEKNEKKHNKSKRIAHPDSVAFYDTWPGNEVFYSSWGNIL